MNGITYCGKYGMSTVDIILTAIIIISSIMAIWFVGSFIAAKLNEGQMGAWNLIKILIDLTEGHRW